MNSLLLEPPAPAQDVARLDAPLTPPGSSDRPRLKKRSKTRLQQASKGVLHWIRRGHLYFGLFLFPWALLYGVTAFLFNHPTVLSDQKTITFERDDYAGEALPSAQFIASEVLTQLNASQEPAAPYELGTGETRYLREFAFATFKSDGKEHNILLDLIHGSGTIREQASRPQANRAPPEPAPFATGEQVGPSGSGRNGGRGSERRGGGAPSGRQQAGVETALKRQVESIIPQICKSVGLGCENLVITSIPEVSFPVRVGEVEWIASYNPLSGGVSGRKPDEVAAPSELTWRRFLLRLHTAHGYPSSGGARWYWAVIVDVMAGVMCFWGLSGILMWWQIKSTRLVGAVTLGLGLLSATGLGVGMHFAMQ